MSELRYDPLRNRWVIIAPERKSRPHEFARPREGSAADVADCPFERGQEGRTPPEILVIPRPGGSGGGPDWQVRVVPNSFPVLRVEGDVAREGSGVWDRVSGVGAHEVIVENPDHHREMADLSVAELALVLRAWRARMQDLRRDVRLRYALIFKNKGRQAGASQSHPHCQLVATPIIPTFLVQELKASREHFQRKERCLLCDVLRHEQRLGERIAVETDRFVALEPYAAGFPFETWVLPTRHGHDFALATDDDLDGLAVVLRDLLRRLRVVLEDPAYNLVLHTAPFEHPRPGQPGYWQTLEHDFHWHLEVVPRITRVAGFEWGSGFTVNPTPPEEAARFLKETDPEG